MKVQQMTHFGFVLNDQLPLSPPSPKLSFPVPAQPTSTPTHVPNHPHYYQSHPWSYLPSPSPTTTMHILNHMNTFASPPDPHNKCLLYHSILEQVSIRISKWDMSLTKEAFKVIKR